MPYKRIPSGSRYRSLDDPDTLRTLVQNLGEGIYITAADGEILDANAAFLRIVGRSTLEELKSIRAEDLYADPAVRQRVKERLDRDGEFREMEVEIRRADGRVVTVLDSSYALRDEGTGEIYFHGIIVDIEERKELERQLFEASIRDALTGTYNRRYLQGVEQEMNSASAEQWACIYVDLDDFKQYNDTHGHAAGDAALIAVGRFLMRELRAQDAVVRVGGDEFVAVLRGITELEMRQIIQRLQEGASEVTTIPFSVGWARRRDAETFASTVERADQRLLRVRGGEKTNRRRRKEDFRT
ncbi:MAG TPA: sensor domain-containing diguanylate cyclase [Gemmatimonadaceae bacterium]|nr:sensor domain-containing diguanylate cyclase [Gemmatimonadaceae bacterium]